MIKPQLEIGKFQSILQHRDITTLNPDDLISIFQQEKELSDNLPEENAVQDPITSDYIIYNSRRGKRPKDNIPSLNKENPCPICSGSTTGIVDLIDLSEGFSFMNKNLFPILYPHNPTSDINQARGFHMLQWTSSIHENNWLNMPLGDLFQVMARVAAVEGYLISNKEIFFPKKREGFVSIIKNFGRKVGGSLEHDHQQIGFSNIMPRRVKDNLNFLAENKKTFPEYLLSNNPQKLIIREYGTAVLVVPYFMQRPLYMTLVMKNPDKNYIYELTQEELSDVAQGWLDAVYCIHTLMLDSGKETAYNIITNTSTGIYFNFLPYTQEFGGFEHMGLYLCQMTPQQAVTNIYAALDKRDRK
jgi:UDPglucose--hexose-1-phosphate uridylyltransferase